jgi:Tol biopolymer transport system component
LRRHRTALTALTILILFALLPIAASAADKLPAEKAGEIGKPAGKVAFLREGAVWMIDVESGQQEKVCDVSNGSGRLTWSPDGEYIMFTRRGQVSYESPTQGEGGQHRLYDLFVASLDSVYANNRSFWRRISNDLGSRDPEWAADGSKVVFYKDLNAGQVDAIKPNYQICTMDPDGENVTMLRKDYANPGEELLVSPSMRADGSVACVFFTELKPMGMLVIGPDEYMMRMDSLKARAQKNTQCVAPRWSPDGKWVAYVSTNMDTNGLYLASADLSEKYLVFSPPAGAFVSSVTPSFSPDGKWLTFGTTDGSVWICDITGNGARRLCGPGMNTSPAWSKTTK